MLNSRKNNRALRNKKKNILTLVLSEKKIMNETKNHNPPPPLQVKWSVPNTKCRFIITSANRVSGVFH
jgi:hypothetical protein